MTDNPLTLVPEQRQRLASPTPSAPYYDETLQHVAQHACVSGNIGKADIRALLKWSNGNQGCLGAEPSPQPDTLPAGLY